MPNDNKGGIFRRAIRTTFTSIRKATLEDRNVSWEARGVLAYLLGKPDHWQMRMDDLIKQGPGGRDRMYRIVNELIEHGYVRRICQHREGGHFDYYYLVYEEPQLPLPEKPYTAKP